MGFMVKDSIDVQAPAEKVIAIAIDFETYPEWNPRMKVARVVEMDGDGKATKVYYEVDARIKTVRYTLAYDYSDLPDSYSWDLVEGDVKELSGSYRFDEFDDVTEVAYELELDPGFPVPGIFRRQGEREIKQAALDGLKKRVESR